MSRRIPRCPGRGRHVYWQKVTSLLLTTLVLVLLRLFMWTVLRNRFSATGQEANLAFFVQVSNTSILQLPRLLKAIWHNQNLYVIHFDVKIGLERRERMEQLLKQGNMARHGNVIVMESESISYAGITMLLNTINGMSQLLRASPDWDFFINLSGSDYPLVSADTIRQLFGSAPVRHSRLNFLQTQIADKDLQWFFDHRMRHVHIDTALWAGRSNSANTEENNDTLQDDGTLIDVNASHPVTRHRASFVKTEGWVILHRSFCEHVVESASARRLLLSFATTRAADELFFGTLLTQTERFRSTIAWDGLRYILWGLHGQKWGRPAYVDEMPEQDEIRDLVTRSGALFARKFAHPESPLLDHIDLNLSGISERSWEVNETSVQQNEERVRKRLFCIVAGRVLGRSLSDDE